MIEIQIARYLEGRGVLEYDEDGTGGDTFTDEMPAEPDSAVWISSYGGAAGDPAYTWDRPSLQVRVRGVPGDYRGPFDRCLEIYRELHSLRAIALPDGTWLYSCFGIQSSPTRLGQDVQGRYEWVLNFRLEVEAAEAGNRARR